MTPRYWYITPAARTALDAAIVATRRANPLDNSPSLSTLQGKAKKYAGGYKRSREALFVAAGLEVRYRQVRYRSAKSIRLVGLVRVAS